MKSVVVLSFGVARPPNLVNLPANGAAGLVAMGAPSDRKAFEPVLNLRSNSAEGLWTKLLR